ncbi:hypothetical protein CDL15_Pgr006553 [Punica granatum]|nr:hypothetical protein CDL15_Pgr006553 [Punica granatum]
MVSSLLFPSSLPQHPKDQYLETNINNNVEPTGFKALIACKQEASAQVHDDNCRQPRTILTAYNSSWSSNSSPSHSLLLSRSSALSSFSSLTLCSSYISRSPSLLMDDVIGTESGVYFSPNEEDSVLGVQKIAYRKNHAREWPAKRNELPPPIPLLVRTANLRGRMPWVMTRHYGHGKLILRVEPVRRHEYFEVYRGNGRLLLDLISLDNSVPRRHPVNENDADEEPKPEQENFDQFIEDTNMNIQLMTNIQGSGV